MSGQNITTFFQKVSDDAELKQRVQDALEGRPEAAAFEIVDLAAAQGCAFTATDLREYLAGNDADVELTEEQLAGAAGGVRMIRALNLTGLRKIRMLSPRMLRARRMGKRMR